MNFYTTHNRLGILGGGQLGKMLINEANKLNIGCKVIAASFNLCKDIGSFLKSMFSSEILLKLHPFQH